MAEILLVEDNEMNRDMLGRRLERRGYSVIFAVDGPGGVAVAKDRRPCLLYTSPSPRDAQLSRMPSSA